MSENEGNAKALPPEVAAPAAGDHPPEQRGIECPRCGCRRFRVVYTRPGLGGRIIRRRACEHCGRRITTLEKRFG